MNKKLRLGPQTLLDLGTQFLAIVVMIILAYNMRSLWALLIGTIVGALARAVISHWVLPGPRIRLGIDRELAAGMFHFGRWITISTMITFVLSQGDRLILGRYMTKTELGVYAIGFLIPQTATTLIGAVASRVLFPLYSRLVAEGGGQLRPRVRKVSPILLAILLPPLWLLMLFSQHIIDFLYDPRYHGAGWILRLFAASASVDAVTSSVGPVLLAMGNSLAVLKINIAKILGMAVLVALGGWLGGTPGLIVGFAAVPVLSYPVIAWFARRSGTWFLRLDAAALVASALILAVGWKLGL
jgi:O-antigen/teichoic acid export membrane protein